MRQTTDLFLINGQPLLAPDENVSVSYEDLDSADSGRDESGVMHRIPVRYKVGSWQFTYSHLTDAELTYLEGLFENQAQFSFTRPSRLDPGQPVTTLAYRSKYALCWQNAVTGLWRNYGFSVIEC